MKDRDVQSQASSGLKVASEKEKKYFHTGWVEGKGAKPLSGKQNKHIQYKIAQ